MGPGTHTRRLERRRGGGDWGRNDSRRAWAATAAVPSEVSAHFSGIYGLKPTPRRIPATGHFPPPAGALAQIGVVGPMARTVAELKALLEVMQGPDDGDPCSAPVPLRWPSEHEVRKLRIGYFEDDGRAPVTAETRTAVHTARRSLAPGGFRSPTIPA